MMTEITDAAEKTKNILILIRHYTKLSTMFFHASDLTHVNFQTLPSMWGVQPSSVSCTIAPRGGTSGEKKRVVMQIAVTLIQSWHAKRSWWMQQQTSRHAERSATTSIDQLRHIDVTTVAETVMPLLVSSATSIVTDPTFSILQLVKSLPFHMPPAWKGYPYRAAPPRIVHSFSSLPEKSLFGILFSFADFHSFWKFRRRVQS